MTELREEIIEKAKFTLEVKTLQIARARKH